MQSPLVHVSTMRCPTHDPCSLHTLPISSPLTPGDLWPWTCPSVGPERALFPPSVFFPSRPYLYSTGLAKIIIPCLVLLSDGLSPSFYIIALRFQHHRSRFCTTAFRVLVKNLFARLAAPLPIILLACCYLTILLPFPFCLIRLHIGFFFLLPLGLPGYYSRWGVQYNATSKRKLVGISKLRVVIPSLFTPLLVRVDP
ncbi:hypothetical protein B0T17DRAFT_157490 [Bombardia bombarda]|uniref:Uncharacterized protein n=1 Tax=Bombardia bombarda TaxID=252184 RepID=A0AA39X754_9PEZI|nr:hypothetical protein B0T17DRAFT_157490 [Bombardia bombarda]